MDESVRAEMVALVGEEDAARLVALLGEDEAPRFAERARVAFKPFDATVTGVVLVFETRLDRDVLVITATDPDGNMYQLADRDVRVCDLDKEET